MARRLGAIEMEPDESTRNGGKRGPAPSRWRLPEDAELDGEHHLGLEDYVVGEMFERLELIEREARQSGVDLEPLEMAIRAAKAELMDYATDDEILKAAGKEAFAAGLESRRSALEEAEAALDEALRKAPRLDRPVRELRQDCATCRSPSSERS